MLRAKLRHGCLECLANHSPQIFRIESSSALIPIRSNLEFRRGLKYGKISNGLSNLKEKINNWNSNFVEIQPVPKSDFVRKGLNGNPLNVRNLNEYVDELINTQYFSSENLFLFFDYLFQAYRNEVPPLIVDSVVLILKNENVPEGTKVDLLILLLLRLSKLNTVLDSYAIQNIYSAWIPYTKNDKFTALLDQLKEAPSPSLSPTVVSLKVHAYITLGAYSDAVSTLSSAKGNADNFVIDLLAYHLIKNNHMELLQKYVSIFVSNIDEDYSYVVPISAQILESISKAAIDNKNLELANTLFHRMIQSTDYPKFNLTDGIITEFIELAASNLNFSVMDKLIAYKIKKITNSKHTRADKNNMVTSFKNEMSILKLNSYVDRLGAHKVIERGMFYVYRFHQYPDISVKDFKHLADVLAKELKESKTYKKQTVLTITDAILLAKQMNGYHIRQYRQRFSKGLHPDEQMNRILSGRVRPMDVSPLELAQRFPVRSSSVGKPHNTSLRSITTPIKFYSNMKILPVNILLSVIARLTTSKSDFRVSLQLAKTMFSKRLVAPNNETLLYLIKILEKSGETGQLLSLLDSFPGIKMTPRCFKLVFNIFIESENVDELFIFLDRVLSKNIFLISNQMYNEMKTLCDKMDDKRYLKYKPTVFELPEI